MAHMRTGSIDDSHPILKGLNTPIANTNDGLIDWDRGYQVLQTRQILPLDANGPSSTTKFLCFRVSLRVLNIVLATCSVLFNVMMNVTLPIYADAVVTSGGDAYDVLSMAGLFFPVIFFGFLLTSKLAFNKEQKLLATGSWRISIFAGFLTALNGVMIVFASPASRTPPYLQGILTTTLVPFTVIFRYLVLRKGVSIQRLACTGVVLVGLFITMEPQIWSLQGSGSDSGNGGSQGLGRFLWPMCFAFGFVPAALLNVYVERVTKQEEAESMVFISWVQLFQTFFVIGFFWLDFVPGFGNASSAHQFLDRLKITLQCNFSSAANCNGTAFKSWMFVFSYCTGNLFSFLLIQYAEGAIYAVVVQALVTPLATLFWTIFKPSPSFHWDPEFNMTTVFTLAGLAVIMPAVIMYSYFSNKEGANRDNNTDTIPINQPRMRDI